MNTTAFKSFGAAVLIAMAAWSAPGRAAVSVGISGDDAIATISLSDGAMNTYDAEVTIHFDTPTDLTAANLNLSAELVNPTDPTLLARLQQPLLDCTTLTNILPGLTTLVCNLILNPLLSLGGGVSVDPAFPMLITVEPVDNLWLFHGSFEPRSSADGNLHFLNAYDFELHAIGPMYSAGTTYRLYKAPVTGQFQDQTSEINNGSVRARGRSGGFSQFIMARDSRPTLLVALTKTVNLELRTLGSTLNATLQGDLTGLLTDVFNLLLSPLNPNYTAAIAKADAFDAEVAANAGTQIDNEWRAQRDLVNDEGDLRGNVAALRFTLVRGQSGF
jgi:hypothetical protein